VRVSKIALHKQRYSGNLVQYIKIKQAITEQIEAGVLSAGQKLPAERKLAEMFETTRVTLREALATLEAEGIIYREDRRGWFISSEPLKYDPLAKIGFVSLAESQQRSGETELISCKEKLANKQATQLLSLAPFSDVTELVRVKSLEKRPVCYSLHYAVSRLAPILNAADLSLSLANIYAENPASEFLSCRYQLSVTALTGDIAVQLRATSGTAAILVKKVFYGRDGEPLCADIEYWRQDAISIQAQADWV